MRLLSCPKPEVLLELATISKELPWREVIPLKLHSWVCPTCQSTLKGLKKSWEATYRQEPEITPSLLRVWSRLQTDETLILSGWKLDRGRSRGRPALFGFLKEGWLVRGALGLSLAGVVALLLVFPQNQPIDRAESQVVERQRPSDIPYVQFRMKDKNTVKVHYVQPELLQTIEFETASAQ